MRLGSDPTDEELAAMTAAELEAWAETQAIGPWMPNAGATAVAPATARLTVRLSRDLVAELEAEAALRRQPAQRFARDLLLLALRQVQAARGAPRRAPAMAVAAVPQPPARRPAPVPLTAEALRARYGRRVHRFAAMVATSPRGVEGLTRAALERAVRALPGYDAGRGDVEGWLWRVVAAAARRWRRLPRWPIRRRSRGRSADALLNAVRALPAREAVAVALRYGADLDLRTAGVALGLSETAARTLVQRGLRRLPGRPAELERRLRALELGPPG